MKKIGIIVLLVISIGMIPTTVVGACESNMQLVGTSSESSIMRADVIITQFRNNNGVRQYRRWNETRGYWVDPDWIDLP